MGSAVAYSQVFAASLNACVTLLNQSAIAQREAPCAALTVACSAGEGSPTTMRTDRHEPGDHLVDLVVSLAGNELRILSMASGRAVQPGTGEVSVSETDAIIFSPKFD